jgi:hypothetical protein
MTMDAKQEEITPGNGARPAPEPVQEGAGLEQSDFQATLRDVGTFIADQKRQRDDTLKEIAGQIMQTYKISLGSEFTAQSVIIGSTYGVEIKDPARLKPEVLDTLWALGARLPEGLESGKAALAASNVISQALAAHGQALTPEQAAIVPELMKGLFAQFEELGVQFQNGTRTGRIVGIKPLETYRDWLVTAGQHFMDHDKYGIELTLTENAIKAQCDALKQAIVAAGDIEVNTGLNKRRIDGVTEVEIKRDGYAQKTAVHFTTAKGEKGSFELAGSYIKDLAAERVEENVFALLFDKDLSSGGGLLARREDIAAVAGAKCDTITELRNGKMRNLLARFGVDLGEKAEMVLVDPVQQEQVTFIYPAKNRDKDEGLVVCARFDERYSRPMMYVATRDEVNERLEMAKRAEELLADDKFVSKLEPASVREYLNGGQRLTAVRS